MTKLGIIESITIYDEGKLETIWFVSKNHVGCISMQDLSDCRFKVGKILRYNDFKVKNLRLFNRDVKHLLLAKLKEQKKNQKVFANSSQVLCS